MNNKFSTVYIHEHIDYQKRTKKFSHTWSGPEDGIVVISNGLLEQLDNDINNNNLDGWPNSPWKMVKVKNDDYESWWMREEFVGDRAIQLEEEISKLRHLLNQACDEIGRAYPDHRVKEIKKRIKEEMSNM